MPDWPVLPPLSLSRYMFRSMRSRVASQVPEEVCGILAADSDGRVRKHFALENVEHSPVRYRMEPKAQFGAMMTIESMELFLLAIYHSHPNGPDHPSNTDIQEWYYPESYALIWYRKNGSWKMNAYLIRDGRSEPVKYTILP